MGIETGDSISFILTIFTVILSIIPSIVPSITNDIPATNLPLFQASIDLQNKSNYYKLFAEKLLHNSNGNLNLIDDDNLYNYNIFNDTKQRDILYQNISNAVEIYNDKSINAQNFNPYIKSLNNTFNKYCINKIETFNVCKNIWFTIRLLILESDHKKNSTEDNVNCREILNETNKCSYGELRNLNGIKSQMNKAFASYFYNERNVTSLEKPIESFVSGLNNFFTAILLSGPTIMLTYIQQKSKKKGNRE
jgi:hypothetical protein